MITDLRDQFTVTETFMNSLYLWFIPLFLCECEKAAQIMAQATAADNFPACTPPFVAGPANDPPLPTEFHNHNPRSPAARRRWVLQARPLWRTATRRNEPSAGCAGIKNGGGMWQPAERADGPGTDGQRFKAACFEENRQQMCWNFSLYISNCEHELNYQAFSNLVKS